MRRSFKDVVQYPYLGSVWDPKTDESILSLGDCWVHVCEHLTSNDYRNLLLVSRGFNIIIQKKRRLFYWSIKQLNFLQKSDKELFLLAQRGMRKLKGVKQLEELSDYPNLAEIKFQEQFPTNRNKKKRELRCGFIPKLVQIIHFGGFNGIIHQNALPCGIVEIYFGDCFNQYLDPDIFQELKNIKILVFGKSFNNGDRKMGAHAFPKSLEVLEINSVYFDQEISSLLNNSPNLTTLKLGDGYKQQITKLPQSIKYLTVGETYNQDLISCINHSAIIYLKFGTGYKHYLDPKLIKRNRNIKFVFNAESYKEVLFNLWLQNLQ
jgi:hypothetical protein